MRSRSPLTGDDYERLWARIKKSYPFFADHEAQAGRTIPVVALTRSSEQQNRQQVLGEGSEIRELLHLRLTLAAAA